MGGNRGEVSIEHRDAVGMYDAANLENTNREEGDRGEERNSEKTEGTRNIKGGTQNIGIGRRGNR